MVLPAPFGISVDTFETALRNIGEGQGRGFSRTEAQFLVALGLAEVAFEPAPPTTRRIVWSGASVPEMVTSALISGVEMYLDQSRATSERYKRIRLSEDGATAYYAAFVLQSEAHLRNLLAQKLLRHEVVQRILSPLPVGQDISITGLQAHVAREFGESLYTSDASRLLALLERYGLVEVTRSPLGYPEESFRPVMPMANTIEDLAGWERVRREVFRAQFHLGRAQHEDEFQQVGHQCREALISLARAVYDPVRHPPLDEVIPSSTDGRRMLDAFIAAEYSGSGNAEIRGLVKSALKAANALTHDRMSDRVQAELCLAATTCVIHLVAIVTGTNP